MEMISSHSLRTACIPFAIMQFVWRQRQQRDDVIFRWRELNVLKYACTERARAHKKWKRRR